MKPQVALLTFSEPRDDFYQIRRPEVEFDHRKAIEMLGKDLDLLAPEPIRRPEQADAAVRACREAQVHAIIAQIPIWTEPSVVLPAAIQLGKPLLLLGNDRSFRTSSLVGLLATGGALDEVGVRHRRLMGNLEDPILQARILAFVRAAYARETLRGQRFGLFGGRSLGMVSATADPAQWLREFGVDTVHVDQHLIVCRAAQVDAARAARHMEWLTSQVGRFEPNGSSLTPAHLERQVRSYLAIRDIVAERRLDFIGVKCQEEMANCFALQCIGQALIGDLYDADGPKESIASACEADMDGALTMQILKLLSGGKPTNLMDVRYYDGRSHELWLANCGSMPTAFAGRSGRPGESLPQVHLLPHVYGAAGGATTQFVAAAGPATLARLMRREGHYWLGRLVGRFEAHDREELRKTTYPWPHAFFASGLDFAAFLARYSSNHIHAVQADVSAELAEFCFLCDLPVDDFGASVPPAAAAKKEMPS